MEAVLAPLELLGIHQENVQEAVTHSVGLVTELARAVLLMLN
jgi:hypothetical protein